MKKTIILLIFIFIFYSIVSLYISKRNMEIPKESIRIRILANSNLDIDQNLKKEVSKTVMAYLNKELSNANNIKDARNKIINSISSIKDLTEKLLINNNFNQDFSINYGYNYFPLKEFNNKLYDEGYYESLLITLGNGLGDNFWCLLFPPLCMIDIDNDIEYTSILKEIFNV